MLEDVKNSVGLTNKQMQLCMEIISNIKNGKNVEKKYIESKSLKIGSAICEDVNGRIYSSYFIKPLENNNYTCSFFQNTCEYKFNIECNEEKYCIFVDEDFRQQTLGKKIDTITSNNKMVERYKNICTEFAFEDNYVNFNFENENDYYIIFRNNEEKIRIPFRDGHLIFSEAFDQNKNVRLSAQDSYNISKEIFMYIIKNYFSKTCNEGSGLDNYMAELLLAFKTPLSKQNSIYIPIKCFGAALDSSTKENFINGIGNNIDQNIGFINTILYNKNRDHAMLATVFIDKNNQYKMIVFDSSHYCGDNIAGLYNEVDESFYTTPVINKKKLQNGGTCAYFAALAGSVISGKTLDFLRNLYNKYSSNTIYNANNIKDIKNYTNCLKEISEMDDDMIKYNTTEYQKIKSKLSFYEHELMLNVEKDKSNSYNPENLAFDTNIANMTFDMFYEISKEKPVLTYRKRQIRLQKSRRRLRYINDIKIRKCLSNAAIELIKKDCKKNEKLNSRKFLRY